MKQKFLKIIVWLGVMTLLTTGMMLLWYMLWHGSQSTESVKWLQFLQTVATFLLPPVVCAWIWEKDHKPFRLLCLDRYPSWQIFAMAAAIMIFAIPAINLLADLNNRIVLPEALSGIEAEMRKWEENAAMLTEQFLKTDSFAGLLVNIGLMALLPALAEELSFRGTLQQVLYNRRYPHLAIWITAIIFSAIHMQFYGFIPRMLMGAMFGYVFVWTGSLWVPVLMHFTNNFTAVLAYYILDKENLSAKNFADTIGAGNTWWVGVLSLIAVGVWLYLLCITSLDLPEYDRRTRKE